MNKTKLDTKLFIWCTENQWWPERGRGQSKWRGNKLQGHDTQSKKHGQYGNSLAVPWLRRQEAGVRKLISHLLGPVAKKKKLLRSKVNSNRNGALSTENCQSSSVPSAAHTHIAHTCTHWMLIEGEIFVGLLVPLPGEGNGNPLQCSCLETHLDRGAWRATVHGVTKSRARLSVWRLCSYRRAVQWGTGTCLLGLDGALGYLLENLPPTKPAYGFFLLMRREDSRCSANISGESDRNQVGTQQSFSLSCREWFERLFVWILPRGYLVSFHTCGSGVHLLHTWDALQ